VLIHFDLSHFGTILGHFTLDQFAIVLIILLYYSFILLPCTVIFFKSFNFNVLNVLKNKELSLACSSCQKNKQLSKVECMHAKRINKYHLLACGGIIAHGVHACMSHGRRAGAGSAGERVRDAGVGRGRAALTRVAPACLLTVLMCDIYSRWCYQQALGSALPMLLQ
jgi:hypothetical protein